jgi:diguanylate cyclase (GGDEF)-like protein
MSAPLDPPDEESPGRILVVDDSLANRELLSQELEDEGFEVETAESGPECLELAHSWHPEVILLDIQMPGMDGIETCRKLKENAETKDIPVLFVTAKRTDDDSVVEALQAGGNDFLPKPYSPPILFARVSSQLSIARAHAQLRRMAMVDELTGVYSRRHLFSSLPRLVKSGIRGGPNGMCLMVIDVDHFKSVNDTQGHLEGDKVLRKIAQTIAESTRETDLVARFGGEEFVVVLPQTLGEGGSLVAEKVRAAVEATCTPVTVSIGLACSTLPSVESVAKSHSGNIETMIRALLKAADEAVYAAKRGGRNRVVAADEWSDG